MPHKKGRVAGIGSVSVNVGLGDIAHREKIANMVDVDQRDYFLAQYPAFFDEDANRLTLAVVKAAVTKLPGVKVIHA